MKSVIRTFIIPFIFLGCNERPSEIHDYPVIPVGVAQVTLTDSFWLPVIRTLQQTTIRHAFMKCRNEGRMDNFLVAGGKKKGETKGAMPFDDTDLYKIVEGASYSLFSSPDSQLEAYLDTVIGIIAIGQEKDGYLTTWKTINPLKPPAPWVKPGGRWKNLEASHELYNSGHLFEAASAHYLATGKRDLLDIACKNADLLVRTFGPGKNTNIPGHQIVETGLIKLFRITGKREYLELAKFFLDQRGNAEGHELYGAYNQDHIPVIRQKEVTGHAVRAVYMYGGMTDIAALYDDTAYRKAVGILWENMVYRKLYITGGIGSRHEGESFGDDYELPDLTAYAETCAAIGSIYWNYRLFLLTGNSKYYDIVERTLYNGMLSGISINGKMFFYANPLEADGNYAFNQGSCTRQSWFDCSCCPTNLIRFIPSIPGMIYATANDSVFINLFVSSKATVRLNTSQVELTQKTGYPWDGRIEIAVNPNKESHFTLKLRVPGWANNRPVPGDLYAYIKDTRSDVILTVNGISIKPAIRNGYVEITRKWKKGDLVGYSLQMRVREVITNEKVEANRNRVALEYGPIVYCAEEIDNPLHFDELTISDNTVLIVRKKNTLLGGVNTIRGHILASEYDINSGEPKKDPTDFVLIPYYAWSNRGVGRMKVWLNRE